MDFFKLALDSVISKSALLTDPEWTTSQMPQYLRSSTQSEYQKLTAPISTVVAGVVVPVAHLAIPTTVIICNLSSAVSLTAKILLDSPTVTRTEINIIPGGYFVTTSIKNTLDISLHSTSAADTVPVYVVFVA